MAESTLPNQEEPGGVKRLRTYQGDIEEVVRSQKTSLADIALAENEKKIKRLAFTEANQPLVPEKGRPFIIGSAILLLLALAGVFGGFYFFKGKMAVAPLPTAVPIVSVDATKEIPVDNLEGDGLRNALAAERKQDKITLSSILGIYFTKGEAASKTYLGASDFLILINSRAPLSLLNSISPRFLFGIHGLSSNQPFIVFKTDYYQSAFAAMLDWEKSLPDDFDSIFFNLRQPSISPAKGATTNSLSTELEKENRHFEDKSFKNRDTRVLRDAGGNTLLLYSFVDQKTIVITTNETTLGEIVRRLFSDNAQNL